MNKVLIECGALIDKYELNRDSIMEQLQSIKVDKGTEGLSLHTMMIFGILWLVKLRKIRWF